MPLEQAFVAFPIREPHAPGARDPRPPGRGLIAIALDTLAAPLCFEHPVKSPHMCARNRTDPWRRLFKRRLLEQLFHNN